jgi:hypothetical protein
LDKHPPRAGPNRRLSRRITPARLHRPRALTEEGLIDARRLRRRPARAQVHRYWEGERPTSGYVIATPAGWAFSYERGADDDERVFHLETHPLRPGDYVTIVDPEGERLPMRVASAQPLDESGSPIAHGQGPTTP